jgi:MarR family transcriptional regulator for hemolysin
VKKRSRPVVQSAADAALDVPFGILLFSLTRVWRTKLNQRLRPIGASSSALGALYHLFESEHGLVQRELAERIGIEGPTLVRLLDVMERDGWVVRVASATDRRQKVVQVTPKAQEAFAAMAAIARELNGQVVAVATPDELAAAATLLRKMTRQLEAL